MKKRIYNPLHIVFLFLALLSIVPQTSSIFAGQQNIDKQPSNLSTQQLESQNLLPATRVNPQLNKAEVAKRTTKLQMPFIANDGQTDERVAFYAKTFGGIVFVTKEGEIVYSLPAKSSESVNNINNTKDVTRTFMPEHFKAKALSYGKSKDDYKNAVNNIQSSIPHSSYQKLQCLALKEELVGSKVGRIKGEDKAITKVSYFRGNDPSKWKSDVSTYDTVSLGEVYGGIELKLKAYGDNVEKLFHVESGADPGVIQLRLNGAKVIKVSENGELVAETELGHVRFTAPVAYQYNIAGEKVKVSASYIIKESDPLSGEQELIYSFHVGEYDSTKELIIDPLLASTYLGESSSGYVYTIVLDSSGNVYIAGFTTSSDFPTTSGAYDTSYSSGRDVFISKLNSSLSSLSASTYLGGLGEDGGYAIALDNSGNVYVTGHTDSPNFPTTRGAYDTSFNDRSDDNSDIFISKLNSSLSSLSASTYLGGSNIDHGNAIALDSSGNVYVTGDTRSSDFPTTSGAYDTSFSGFGVYISKLNSTLSSISASTYLNAEYANDIALDNSGNVYVTGSTSSTDFPTTSGAYDTSFNGYGDTCSEYTGDIFISKLNSSLSHLSASTYLGGTSDEIGSAIALDSNDNVYITGETYSADFPTTSNAYDTSSNNSTPYGLSCSYNDVFISNLNSSLSSLLASTYLSGSGAETGYAIDLDSSGNVYVTGYTYSSDFPTTTDAYDSSYNDNIKTNDIFISKLNSSLSSLSASTYLGGSKFDYGEAIALDSSDNVYVTGGTTSSDFPTTNDAYEASSNNSYNKVFISKLDNALSSCKKATAIEVYPAELTLQKNESNSIVVTVTGKNGCPAKNQKVKATIDEDGKDLIRVTPQSIKTDAYGKAIFTVTAKSKTGDTNITFKVKNTDLEATVSVSVVE